MSLAVGETHGNGISDELPTPKGLNVSCAELMGRIFDPFRVGNSICWRAPIRGFHPRLMILFPFGEHISASLNALSFEKGRANSADAKGGEPAGIRTQNPCLKRAVLYR